MKKITIAFVLFILLLFSACCSRQLQLVNSAALTDLTRIEDEIDSLRTCLLEPKYDLNKDVWKATELIENCCTRILELSETRRSAYCDPNLSIHVLVNLSEYGGQLGWLLNDYKLKNELYSVNPLLKQYDFEDSLWLKNLVKETTGETIKELKMLELNLLMYLYIVNLDCN